MLAEVDIPSLEIGTEIQDIKGMDGFRQALAQMVADSQINTDEVNAILNGISFNPDVTVEDIPVKSFDKTAFESENGIVVNGKAFSAASSSYHYNETTGYVRLVKVNGKKSNFTGGGAPVKTGGKGGGGGGSKKAKEKKPVDNKDRYHTVD
mgnify:CR=1 FL=1